MPATRPLYFQQRHAVLATAAILANLTAAAAMAQTPLPPPYNYAEPPPAAPRRAPLWQEMALDAADQRYRMPVYANHKLSGNLRSIRQVVVLLHGTKRDADQAYLSMTELLAGNRQLAAHTLILAPEFPTPIDAAFGGAPAWRKGTWENGGKSVRAAGRPTPVSSFQVLDDLLHALQDRKRLPGLSRIVLAAHASGAQLLQRYAVLNDIDGSVRRGGTELRYIIANAPSYLYLTRERPRRGDGAGYAPYERGICPTYNHYPYGPDKLPAYATNKDLASLYVRYGARRITYLLGSADNNPEDPTLDKSCGAEAQGATRLARGLNYLRYDMLLAGRGVRPVMLRHDSLEVAGVGHDAAAMYGSECGVHALLGDDASAPPGAAPCRPVAPLPR